MRRRASIRAQLLRLVLAVALPLAGLEAWNLYATAEAESQHAREEVLYLAQVTASETAKFLGDVRNTLNGLAARAAVSTLDPAHCDPILKDFLGLAPRFANVVTMTLDGSVICSGVPAAQPARGDPDRFLKLLRRPDELTVGMAAPGVITGRWVVPVGRPLLNAQGDVAGAVVVPLDLIRFPLLPGVDGLLANAVVGLVAGDGTVLARSQDSQRFVGTKLDADRNALREKTGTAEVIGIDGIARIQGFAPVPGTDWIAIASLPASEVFAGVKARIATSALVSSIVLFVALMLAVRWSRKIREPIAALAGAASEVAAGNLAARAPVAGAVEITRVATEFNRMLDSRARAEAELREAERRFRDMLAGVELVSVILDAEGRIVYCNDFLLRLTGWRREEVSGRNWFALFIPPEPGDSKNMFLQMLKGETPLLHFENEILTRSGERRLIHWNNSFLRAPEGEITGTASIGEDITERKRAEAKQQELNRRIAAILESVSDDFVAFDREWRYTYVNSHAAEMFGRSVESLIGRNYYAAYPEAAGTPIEQAYRKTMTERVPVFIDVYDAPSERWFENHIYPTPEGISVFFHDTTERKRAEAALRESEARFRGLTELSSDWYWEQDEEFKFVEFSSGAVDHSGFRLASYIGMTRWELPGVESSNQWWASHRAALEAHQPFRNFESRRVSAAGETIWISASGTPTFDEHGRFKGYRGVARNITERKRAEARIARLASLYSAAYETSSALLRLRSRDEVFHAACRIVVTQGRLAMAWIALAGKPGGRVLVASHFGAGGDALRDLVVSTDASLPEGRGPTAIAIRENRQCVVNDLLADPAILPWREFNERHGFRSLAATPITTRGSVIGSLSVYATERELFDDEVASLLRLVASDISFVLDVIEMERTAHLSAGQLEVLSRRVLQVQEQERAAIARELHDEVGGVLTAVKLNLHSLRAKRAGDPGEAALADGLALVDGAIQSVRSLSLDLRPAVLDDLGLIPALKWYCARQAQRSGVAIELALDAIDLKLLPELESGCFRIVQEAVTNALRHANPRNVKVSLLRGDVNFVLEIADDGVGFEVAAARARGLAGEGIGLHGMEERTKLLDGEFVVDSAPGAGTRIRAEFALPEDGFA